MSESNQSGNTGAVIGRQVFVCLLLALLFFFNPFFLPPESASGLSLLHPPSYRATVASAELLKFKNPENLNASTIADCEEIEGFLPSQQEQQTSETRVSADEPLPADLLLSGNVWFRPPPAA
jgi:hypothetical protein